MKKEVLKKIDNKLENFARNTILLEVKKTYDFLKNFPNCPATTHYLTMLLASLTLGAESAKEPEESFISLMAFWEKYRICSPSHLSRLLKQNAILVSMCAKFSNGKWYVRPVTTINFIAAGRLGSVISKRCVEWLIKQESKSKHGI